jgi:hypothetical protein
MIPWIITFLVVWWIIGTVILIWLFDAPERPLIYWSNRRLALVLAALGPSGWVVGVMMLVLAAWWMWRLRK